MPIKEKSKNRKFKLYNIERKNKDNMHYSFVLNHAAVFYSICIEKGKN